jgi:hypothetical protein
MVAAHPARADHAVTKGSGGGFHAARIVVQGDG